MRSSTRSRAFRSNLTPNLESHFPWLTRSPPTQSARRWDPVGADGRDRHCRTSRSPSCFSVRLSCDCGLTCRFAPAPQALSAFSLLRPNNTVVYQPKVKYSEDNKHPPKIGKGIFDWVEPVFKSGEQELMQVVGLDGVTFLRALRMCRNMSVRARLGAECLTLLFVPRR